MRLGYAFGFLAALVSTVSSTLETADPEGNDADASGRDIPSERHNELIAIATFAEQNMFGHVVNGEKNKMIVNVDNQSGKNITLQNIAGSFHDAQTGKLLSNISAVAHNLPLVEGIKIQLPYSFHSEYKPGEMRLNLWIEHLVDGEKQRMMVYDSIVTIVEPEGSIFDLKMLITYIITLGLVGGLSYYTYLTLVPRPKKKSKRVPASSANSAIAGQDISSPTSVTATGAGGYQEEWIPAHHLKKERAKSGGKGRVPSGRDEAFTSGGETSGAEGRKKAPKK